MIARAQTISKRYGKAAYVLGSPYGRAVGAAD